MLVPTSSAIILSNDQKDESLNTIKVDFSKMSFVQSTKQNYTQCLSCRALLTIDTIQDKKYISYKNTDQSGKFLWVCRFCKKQNRSSEVYFVSSNFKYCLEKNVTTKIVPPIIIFLIDISGSMTSSIYMDLWARDNEESNKKNVSLFTNQLKKIIQDSVMRKNQIQYLNQLQKSFGNKHDKDDKLQHFSKLSFLFAIIEYHLKILKSKKQKSQYRVGFIFFSDTLTVLKGAKQKFIPVYVDQTDQIPEQYPFKQEKIDFNSFQELYQKGKTYDRYFGDSRFGNFDITKLAVQHIKTGGKTALGPALAFATGILSQHDQGSKILLVTDSIPNHGIFSSKQTSSHYKRINQVLNQNKGTIGVFRLVNSEFQNSGMDADFEKFLRSNEQNIKLIEISLKPSITQQVLENVIKSLRNLINHESLGHSYNLTILNQNKKITLNKLKYDNIDYRNLRFITSQSKNWVQIQLQKKQIQQNDFLFPVMTQLVIEYDDIFTKEKCLFMSFVIQRIVRPYKKYQPENAVMLAEGEQQYEKFTEEINLENIQNLIDMQSMKKFEQERQTEAIKKRTFRNQLKNIIIKLPNNAYVQSIDCQSINDYTSLKNQLIGSRKQNQFDQYYQLEYQSL